MEWKLPGVIKAKELEDKVFHIIINLNSELKESYEPVSLYVCFKIIYLLQYMTKIFRIKLWLLNINS